MKRSDLYIRITTIALFLAVVCYLGVYIYNAVINTYVTTPAITYSIEEAIEVSGYIVRAESVIGNIGETVLPTVSEGEKVASGQAVAVEYRSGDTLQTASEIRALRLKIAKLEASEASSESKPRESVLELSKAVRSGRLNMLDELSINIETYIFSTKDKPTDELPELRAQLETLERRSAGMRTIYAPVSGVFSSIVDGYEHITPDMLAGLAPESLEILFESKSGVIGVGKLVTEFTWYFVTVMNAGDALRLPSGEQIMVQFSGIYNTGVQMTVESVGKRVDGRCVVLLSCDRGIHDVAQLREMSADIVYNVISGIRVPKEAMHLGDDGTTFVYLQTGVRAERVDAEILRTTADSYVVRDGMETGSPLRAGATIIVKAKGLYDGKIVG